MGPAAAEVIAEDEKKANAAKAVLHEDKLAEVMRTPRAQPATPGSARRRHSPFMVAHVEEHDEFK